MKRSYLWGSGCFFTGKPNVTYYVVLGGIKSEISQGFH